MSSPDLFLHSITLIMMIAMSVMPATAAITIHSVLFLSAPPAACAATTGSLGKGVEVRAVKSQNSRVTLSYKFINLCLVLIMPLGSQAGLGYCQNI